MLLAGIERSLQELSAPCKIHAAVGKIQVTVQKGWACHGECSTLLARIERSSQELTTACKNRLHLARNHAPERAPAEILQVRRLRQQVQLQSEKHAFKDEALVWKFAISLCQGKVRSILAGIKGSLQELSAPCRN